MTANIRGFIRGRRARIERSFRKHWEAHEWEAILWLIWWTVIREYGGETCQHCERPYRRRKHDDFFIWHSPQPLWQELNGRYSGLICPPCFNRLAKEAGVWLTWTPMV